MGRGGSSRVDRILGGYRVRIIGNVDIATLGGVRKQGPVAMTKKLRPRDRHKVIVKAILTDKLTAQEAADRFNLTRTGIYNICHKFHIKTRKRRKEDLPTKFPQIANEEWLRVKFVDEYLTYRAIADIVGCSKQSVQQRLNGFGITRPWISRAKPKKPKRVIPLKGLLRERRIRAMHNGKRFIGRVMLSGAIKLLNTGEVFDSPCEAAQAVSGRKTVNGWEFWKYQVSEGCWVPLATLKEG